MDVKMEDAPSVEVVASPSQLQQRTPEKRKLELDADVETETRMQTLSPLQIRTALTPLKDVPSEEPPSSPLSPLSSIGTGTWSRAASVAGEDGTTPAAGATATTTASADTTNAPPSKKRKLTPGEKLEEQRRREEAKREKARIKEEKDREREEKLRQKEEERKKKEEEKRAKDEEKRTKEEEKKREREEKQKVKDEEKKAKEEERKAKEEEKKAKEEEKLRKEEELRKKAASQMKLGAFFIKAKPSSPSKPSANEVMVAPGETSVPSPEKKSRLSDYERTFQAFEVRANVQLAPFNRFTRDHEAVLLLRSNLDTTLPQQKSDFVPSKNFAQLCNIPPFKRRKVEAARPSVRTLMGVIQQSSEDPVPNGIGLACTPDEAMRVVKSLPVKFLKFHQDVRPPYHGTFTKYPSKPGLQKNPFERSLPPTATDYDYDSEAEWVEQDEEDGEDLNSEGEEELEDDDDDMDEFLDDDEAVVRAGINDIGEPVCSGICWEDSRGVNLGSMQRTGDSLERYRFEVLTDATKLPINPFPVPEPPKVKDSEAGAMKPPRAPLHAVKRENNILNTSPTQATLDGTLSGKVAVSTTKTTAAPTPANTAKSEKGAAKAAKPSRQIAADDLDAFKRAVEGSDLTKTGLIEILKKQFPKEPKDAIKTTLETVAKRVGSKEVDKKWVLIA